MEKKPRTKIDFSKHELLVKESNDLTVHYLKIPNTRIDSIKYINTNGILAVTGDYGNWIFCREFIPSKTSDKVSDYYWCEKLQILSTQEPFEFDEDMTKNKINEYLNGEHGDLTEEEREYLNDCLERLEWGEESYVDHAYDYACGRFSDYEYVINCKQIKYWLRAVFDGYDEIVRRYQNNEVSENNIVNEPKGNS